MACHCPSLIADTWCTIQVTTGDPVTADPRTLVASRGGAYDAGAAPRTGCTVTTAYANAPANAGWDVLGTSGAGGGPQKLGAFHKPVCVPTASALPPAAVTSGPHRHLLRRRFTQHRIAYTMVVSQGSWC